MKKTLILTALLASVPAFGFSQTTFAVRNTATWVEAVSGIRGGGNDKEYTITVTGTISVPGASSGEETFGSVTGVTVTIEGNGTLSLSANGSLLNIGKGQTIVARDITLQGRSNNDNNSLVSIISGGTFRMEGKASVTGNTASWGGGVYVGSGTFTMSDGTILGNTGTRGGGGVVVYGGTFTMEGGTISGNTSIDGGGVFVANGGNFTMQDGTISGNTSSYEGGGVHVDRGTFTIQGSALVSGNTSRKKGSGVYFYRGTFTMQGGSISNNTSSDDGGGVYVSGSGYAGIFIMENGTISGNTSIDGGGVFVANGGNFTMQDGTISGNTGTYCGGGVYVGSAMNTSVTFTMKGGTISGNTAAYYGGGVMISGEYMKFTKTDGTIYGDDAEQKLKNTVISGIGHAMYDKKIKNWRNASAGPTMNTDRYGFWLNDGDVVMFPSDFQERWKRSNFNNILTIEGNVIKSSSSGYYWILQRISGNAYTLKRADASNTMTLTIRLDGHNLVISGDSGSGENNWNGTWR